MPETEDISKLANILHENGDKVLNALSKLSLNATLLQKINKEFQLFFENDYDKETNNFQVLPNNNCSQIMQDLNFLHDFIQKTIGLKITNISNLSLHNKKVDISKFKSLKYLEIKKVPVKEIVGLKLIQSQLESVVCMRSLSKLEELLAECGGDNSVGFVWSELKEAVISYNNIKTIDTSIAFAPWLQVLDLSHNQIVNVKAIDCLPNLQYINLSFNCLNMIPTFNKSARKKIQVLVIKNNYIEDLSGLTGLDYLTELDVSGNWVSNYEYLYPFLGMSALQNLSLQGNPMNYHKNYRQNVVCYLHISASLSDFVLDGRKLSKYEKSIVGQKLCQPPRPTNSSLVESFSNSSSLIQSPGEDNKIIGKKSGKAKLAVIPNLDDGTYEEILADISAISFKDPISTEHLITKKKIEDTRATYGSDNWLRCEAGSVVQDILGLPPTETFASTPLDEYCLEAALASEHNLITTKVDIENHSDNRNAEPNTMKFESFGSCLDVSVRSSNFSNEDSGCKQVDARQKVESENVGSKETSPDIEPIQYSSEEIEDDNEKLYLVIRISKAANNETQEELFLTLTDSEIKEKDSNRGRVINKWSLDSLSSCTKLRSTRLHLTFDTVKRDKRDRIYEMESAEAHLLYKMLTDILESRPLNDMNQIAYKCVSCSSQFSKELNPQRKDKLLQCPFCNSKLILEVDDTDKSCDKALGEVKNPKVIGSHNRSSSAGFIPSQATSKFVKCSSQSSISSVSSLDELNELPALQNINVKRSDSDIEILSNPSQSSIEVIDGPVRVYGGYTPRRKRSSEEKQVVQPAVPVSSNSVSVFNVEGLTESGSSGSVTDSVCTAYESSQTGHKTDVSLECNASKVKGTKIFETVEEEAIAGKQHMKTRSQAADEIQYSYTNFEKIDHRIKLFVYSQLFEDSGEEFCFLLRCAVLPNNSNKSFQSCIVSSNKKLYILKVTAPEVGDDASNFLLKSNSLQFSLKSIRSINILAWDQGFSVKLAESHSKLTEFLILLKDTLRTQNFLKFLQSSQSLFPASCRIITEYSGKLCLAMQHLLVSGASEDPNVQYFSLLNSCSIVDESQSKNISPGAILTNSEDLLLFVAEPTWFFEGPEDPPKPLHCQKLRNLMSIEGESCRTCLQFLNESEEKEEVWDLAMETRDAVEGLISALRFPWEEMFSVPLQVSHL